MPADTAALAPPLRVARLARDDGYGYGGFSTGEQLAAALVLNRADWLPELGFTIAEARERLAPNRVAQLPAEARALRDE